MRFPLFPDVFPAFALTCAPVEWLGAGTTLLASDGLEDGWWWG